MREHRSRWWERERRQDVFLQAGDEMMSSQRDEGAKRDAEEERRAHGVGGRRELSARCSAWARAVRTESVGRSGVMMH